MEKINVCKKCDRTYMRKTCEFCQRISQWRDTLFLDSFPIRIRKDLGSIKDKELEKLTGTIMASMQRVPGSGVFIHGVVGSGKTFLACKVMLAFMKENYVTRNGFKSYLFCNVPDLLQRLKAGIKDNLETSIVEELTHVDLLIFDDIGVGKESEWFHNILYLIINHRYAEMKPTIFTSNKTEDELVHILDDRIVSRIAGMTIPIERKPKDYRIC